MSVTPFGARSARAGHDPQAATQSLLSTVLRNEVQAKQSPLAAVKALAWARVSTEMQEDRGLSLPEQTKQIREYAEKEGIEIVGEFSEAESAFQAKAKRPEFHRMLQRAKDDPEIGIILVHDFSRFSRDALGARILIRELRNASVQVVSVTDPSFDPESVAGVYMEAITFAKNEAYSREVSFHTRKGCRANIQTRDPETTWCYKNGGQPLWGYKAQRLERGGRRGKPLVKCIWVPDDTVVSGKPIHQWTRECLAMAEGGATLDELRDFCNRNGIPAPRQKYWGQSTWYALIQPYVLLKYAGYEVWNVHRKNGTKRPPEEWVVVERAHAALIPEDQALRIIQRREGAKRTGNFGPKHDRSLGSPYLLSGGLFICGRCGKNMIGLRTAPRSRYYVCSSAPYRKGLGCGRGVYVPQDYIENEVLDGVRELLAANLDPDRLARQVNEEVARSTQDDSARSKSLEKEIAAVEGKIENIRKALEEGLSDAAWANGRLDELQGELGRLEAARPPRERPPRLNSDDVTRYLQNLSAVLDHASQRERKELLRLVVESIKLAPERQSVEIVYRAPGPNLMLNVVAGVGFEPTT